MREGPAEPVEGGEAVGGQVAPVDQAYVVQPGQGGQLSDGTAAAVDDDTMRPVGKGEVGGSFSTTFTVVVPRGGAVNSSARTGSSLKPRGEAPPRIRNRR